MNQTRPRVRIRFRYNIDTGEIEEFIIDDQAATASEAYHDKVAHALASRLSRDPAIEDAGPVRGGVAQRVVVGTPAERETVPEPEQDADADTA
ncbi:MAG: hypothetical protein RBT75_12640 [Anaerolineae bacterium]|jgi:hypothetical protein|nr:hypothetical protein [Anaerolineae bacterium]